MKKLISLACGAAAIALLAGCASDGGYYGYNGVAAVGYDGYYDDFYGPIDDGYWGVDGGYYYRHGREWRRDSGNHFRHEAGQGFHPMHGSGRGGTHTGGHDHDHH
jgi:hypothetical protein